MPLAQGTVAVPAQKLRKDAKSEKPLCFKKGYYDCKVCPCFTQLRYSTNPVPPSLKDTRLYSPGHTGLHFHTQAWKQLTDRLMPRRRAEGILTASTRAREPFQLRKQELLPLLCDMARKEPEPSSSLQLTHTSPANRKCRSSTAQSCTKNVQRSTWHSRNLKNLCYPSAFKQGESRFFFKPKLKAKR